MIDTKQWRSRVTYAPEHVLHIDGETILDFCSEIERLRQLVAMKGILPAGRILRGRGMTFVRSYDVDAATISITDRDKPGREIGFIKRDTRGRVRYFHRLLERSLSGDELDDLFCLLNEYGEWVIHHGDPRASL